MTPLVFSPKQRRVLTWWRPGSTDCGHQALICGGAVRSGKTLCAGLSFLCWATLTFQGRRFALCGKTIQSVRRNLWSEVQPVLRALGFSWTERLSRGQITLRLGERENTFLLFGGSDERAAGLIQGVTLAGALLDEAVLMPRSFVEQVCARCSVEGSRLWFTCNPESPGHWFYQEWIRKAEEKGALHLTFTMADNPGLSPEVLARYKAMFRGTFYRRFVLGEWTAAQGRVYGFYDPERDPEAVPEGTFSAWRVSVDYGTANPASFGLWGKLNGAWYRTEEYYYDSRQVGQQKTDAEYVEDLRTLLAGRRPERMIVDPSAASFIQALRRAGFPVTPADNDVADGIRVTADLLKRRRIILCRSCRDCLREMAVYCWDTRKDRDAPRKEQDHAMDDLRYFAMDLAGEERGGFAAAWVERRSAG